MYDALGLFSVFVGLGFTSPYMFPTSDAKTFLCNKNLILTGGQNLFLLLSYGQLLLMTDSK